MAEPRVKVGVKTPAGIGHEIERDINRYFMTIYALSVAHSNGAAHIDSSLDRSLALNMSFTTNLSPTHMIRMGKVTRPVNKATAEQ